jgi:hypothetical protein
MSRPRLRFSLLTILLVTTIVGLAVVVVMQWREVIPLRTAVRKLRDEVGALSIEDPTKIHAIQVRTDEKLLWKWRVWIPEGEIVDVHMLWGDVPRTGYPKSRTSSRLEPGENWLTLKVVRDSANGIWMAELNRRGGGVSQSIPDEAAWFDWGGSVWFDGEGVGHSTRAETGHDRDFVLLRTRAAREADLVNRRPPDRPLPGFIVWLERQ